MIERFAQAEARLELIQSFMRSYHCFYVLAKSREKLDAPLEQAHPFRHLSNVLLYDIFTSWCKVFGTDKEPCHWKKLILNQDLFRKFLFQELECTKEEFALTHSEIMNFRDNYIAHHNTDNKVSRVPKLKIARKSIIALNNYILALPEFDGKLKQPKPIDSYGAYCAKALAFRLEIPYTPPYSE